MVGAEIEMGQEGDNVERSLGRVEGRLLGVEENLRGTAERLNAKLDDTNAKLDSMVGAIQKIQLQANRQAGVVGLLAAAAAYVGQWLLGMVTFPWQGHH